MIVLNVVPIPKPRMTQRDVWKKRPCVERYYAFKDDIKREAGQSGYILGDKFENVKFVLPMPKSWSEKKKCLMDGKPHQQKSDLDNLIKAMWDCLSEEDSNIYEINNVKKVWGRVGCIMTGC